MQRGYGTVRIHQFINTLKMQVDLTFVKNEQKISKAGRPYTACAIKTTQHGDKFINGLGGNITMNWNVGDTVECDIFEEEYNGKMYTKFKVASRMDQVEKKVQSLEARILKLEQHGSSVNPVSTPPSAQAFEQYVNEPPEYPLD